MHQNLCDTPEILQGYIVTKNKLYPIFMVQFSYTSDPENKKLCIGSLMTYHPHFKAKIHNLKKWKVYYREQIK
jgi:hypothetical protein